MNNNGFLSNHTLQLKNNAVFWIKHEDIPNEQLCTWAATFKLSLNSTFCLKNKQKFVSEWLKHGMLHDIYWKEKSNEFLNEIICCIYTIIKGFLKYMCQSISTKSISWLAISGFSAFKLSSMWPVSGLSKSSFNTKKLFYHYGASHPVSCQISEDN